MSAPSPPPLELEPWGMAQWPPPTLAAVQQLASQLDEASRTAKPDAIRGPLPADQLCECLKAAFDVFKDQPTLIDLDFTDSDVKVAVVGDTHGQFHDVLGM